MLRSRSRDSLPDGGLVSLPPTALSQLEIDPQTTAEHSIMRVREHADPFQFDEFLVVDAGADLQMVAGLLHEAGRGEPSQHLLGLFRRLRPKAVGADADLAKMRGPAGGDQGQHLIGIKKWLATGEIERGDAGGRRLRDDGAHRIERDVLRFLVRSRAVVAMPAGNIAVIGQAKIDPLDRKREVREPQQAAFRRFADEIEPQPIGEPAPVIGRNDVLRAVPHMVEGGDFFLMPHPRPDRRIGEIIAIEALQAAIGNREEKVPHRPDRRCAWSVMIATASLRFELNQIGKISGATAA